jgi:hypothetical protein
LEKAEDGGSRFLQYVDPCLPNITVQSQETVILIKVSLEW